MTVVIVVARPGKEVANAFRLAERAPKGGWNRLFFSKLMNVPRRLGIAYLRAAYSR